MTFRVIDLDPVGDEPQFFFDTTFGRMGTGDAFGDWALAGADEPQNAGGLRAQAPIETAMALCLLTEARARPEDRLPPWIDNRRGWVGDTFDINKSRHEGDLGSRLWTLQWADVTEETRLRAEALAREALQTLVAQGLCRSITVRAELQPEDKRIDIEVNARGAVGSEDHSRRFAIIWERQGGVSYPLHR